MNPYLKISDDEKSILLNSFFELKRKLSTFYLENDVNKLDNVQKDSYNGHEIYNELLEIIFNSLEQKNVENDLEKQLHDIIESKYNYLSIKTKLLNEYLSKLILAIQELFSNNIQLLTIWINAAFDIVNLISIKLWNYQLHSNLS